MAKYTTTLNFETAGQSLWAPGESIPLQIDTGDDLIWTVGGSSDVGFDLLGNGFQAEAYFDLTIGLFAFASLGETGSFDASLSMSVGVEMPGGIRIDTVGTGQTIPATFDVSINEWTLIGATLETSGFSAGAKAGLHFILGVEAGLRNGEYFSWFKDGTFDDVKLIDIDFSEPLESSIPLVEISTASPELELQLTDGITITASLPTGADTEAEVAFRTGDSATITAKGSSGDQFISLNADLDELLVKYASKIPGVGAVIKGLGETVFAEHKFDLNDYLPIIPRGKLVLSATALDIGASTGLVITEENTLDFDGNDTVPNVTVTLRSDNGTPDYLLDDQTRSTALGGTVAFDRPVYNPAATGPNDVPDIGEISVQATYALNDVRFDHKIGLGLNTVFTIEALAAELGGSWVPSALQVNFGPLLSLELPDGGFNVDLFSVPLPGFDVATGAFNSVTETYNVFFTTELAPGQNTEADLEQPNARQAIIDYREARQVNLAETAALLDDLFTGSFQQISILAGFNNFNPAPTGGDFLMVWDGEQDSQVTGNRTAGGLTAINPVNKGTGRLTVNVADTINGTSLLTNAMGYDVSDPSDQTLLLAMGNASAQWVQYTWDKFSGADRTLQTQVALDVIGGDYGDVLFWFDDASGQLLGNLMDGGANLAGEYDRFVGNFSVSHNNAGIEWDLREAVMTGNGVTLELGAGAGDDLTIRNVEAMSIITGDQADYITGYIHGDYIFTNGGEDFVILPGDNANDTAYLGDGNDYLRTEFKAGGGADLVWGGRGYDLVTVRADAAGLGLRVDVIDDNVRSAGGNGYHAASSLLDLQTLIFDYWDYYYNGSTVAQEDRTGLVGTDSIGDVVRYSQLDGSGTESVINFNSSVESLSVEGQDDDGDLVLFTGGNIYKGGSDLGDTFVGDLGIYARGGQGYSIGGSGDVYNQPGFIVGDTYIEGFERWAIRATDGNDSVSGGFYGDYLDGAGGDDVLFGGDDLYIDVISGSYGRDTVWWFDSGADIMTGDGVGDRIKDPVNDPIYDKDTLIIGQSLSFGANGGLNFASLSDFGNWDGTGRTHRTGMGIVDATSSGAVLLAALAEILLDDAIVGVSYGGSDLSDMALYAAFEKVNIEGSGDWDDVLFYQNGATYYAGERANDADVFVADFSAEAQGIELKITDDDPTGHFLSNGVYVQGLDRLIVTGSRGTDVLHGGRLSDILAGGTGSDRLFGGLGDDTLLGGDGDDVVYWMVDGWDEAHGGAGNDRLIVVGADPAGDTRGLGILLDEGQGTEFDYIGGDLSLMGIEALLFSLSGATTTTIQADRLSTEPLSTTIALDYTGFELIDVIGSDAESDLIVYQGGSLYWGGTGAATDLFVADLSAETNDLYFDVGHMSEAVDFLQDEFANPSGTGFAGTFNIGNGTFIGAFERLGLALGSGDDHAVGGSESDYLAGGDGDDTLESGGSGSEQETLLGQAGDDFLVHSGGEALLDGGTGGADWAQIGAMPFAVWLGLGDSGGTAKTILPGDLVDFADMVQLVADLDFYPSTHVSFDGGSNNIATVTGIERMSLHGSSQGDVLMGMSGYSQLYGGAGNDILISGAGRDLLLGGAGVDRYVFVDGFGNDLVAGETLGGAQFYFPEFASTDLTFNNLSNDLEIITPNGTVRVNDWFNLGGLDFTIFTTDNTTGFAVPGDTPGGTSPAWNIVNGTEGDDTGLAGTAGADSIIAGGGNDEMLGSGGSDVFDGGAGMDIVSYADLDAQVYINLDILQGLGGISDGDVFGNVEGIIAGLQSATLIGDVEDNFFAGSPMGDFLFGYGGDDMIIGQEGNDTFYGGSGDDALFGDEGDDTIQAEWGADYVDGGDGNDTIDGGTGEDTLSGGAGNDTVLGGAGRDILVYGGDDLPDTPLIEGGLDSLDGGTERDLVDLSLFSQSAIIDLGAGRVDSSDTPTADPTGTLRQLAVLTSIEEARGSAFDDIIRGSADSNHIEGGLGDDTLSGGYLGDNTIFGGDGIDFIDYGDSTVSVNLDFDPSFGAPTMYGGSFTDQLDDIEGVIGSDLGDGIQFWNDNNFGSGGLGNDYLYGRGGDDVLGGGAGDDTIDGGDGTDIYDVSDAAQAVAIDIGMDIWDDGLAGNDTVRDMEGVKGTAFNDTIDGDIGTNIILGEGGNDLIRGQGGADLLDGGAGNDTLIAGAPQIIYVKPESAENNLWEEAPLLNDYMTLTPRRTSDVTGPTATVHATAGSSPDGFGVTELYRVNMDEGDTLIVDIDSTTDSGFDPFIRLGTQNGVTLHSNDDGGIFDTGSTDANGNRDPFMTYTLPANFGGEVAIRVGQYDSSADGNFGNVDPGREFVMHVTLIKAVGSAAVDAGESGSVLFGGDGNDLLQGGTGEDEMVGGAGADTLKGGANDDLLDGSAGRDLLLGQLGNDLLGGGDSHDTLNGGAGRDTVNGGGGDDLLQDQAEDGMAGSDWFIGGQGNDTILAQGGDDTIRGDAGADSIEGGIGDDVIDGGTWADVIDGGSGNDSILGGGGNDSVRGGVGRDHVELGDGNDRFDDETQGGTWGQDTVYGGDGNDSLIGGGGTDELNGGIGDDHIEGGDDWDIVSGGDGNDTVLGGGGGDILYGDAGADSILGGWGIDYIEGGDGSDTILGEGSSDEILGNNGDDVVDGGAGLDTLYGGAGKDTLTGGTGDDSISGGTWADVIDAGDGNDTVRGDGGADSIMLGDGADLFLDDTQTGNGGSDTVSGGAGNDTLTGDGGADSLSGDGGNDSILGGGGNDTISGGWGADSISMGTGNDLFNGSTQGGTGGRDTVFGDGGQDTLLAGGGDDIVDGGDGHDRVVGGNGNDTVRGGAQNDTLVGQGGDDLLVGGLGADVAYGGAGNDTWVDDSQVTFGNDTVFGGLGNDTISLFGGDDVASGGGDADTFYLNQQIGNDTIQDFTLGEDALQVHVALWLGNLDQARLDALSNTSSGTLVLEFDNGDSLTLNGLTSNAGLLSDITLF